MFAEVITGRFGDKQKTGDPYNLPTSAEVGLPVLDEAHAALLALLNAAHRALTAGDETTARLQLDRLRSEMATHFEIEEQVMQKLGFPAMHDHNRRHAASIAELDSIGRASRARGGLRIGDLDLCFQALIDEVLRGDIDLKSHFESLGSVRSAQQRDAS